MSFKKDPFFLIYGLLLVVGTIIYFFGDHGDTVLWANRLHTPATDVLFKWLTYLGDGIFFGIATLLLLIRNWRTGLVVLGMGLTQTLVSAIFKRVIFRGEPRPKTFFSEFEGINLHFVEGVKVHAYNSFPSGHTLTAFALATFMAGYLKDTKMTMLFLVLATLAGFSRVYLAQHFLIDVCVGSFLGVVIGYVFHRLNESIST
ncbi:MAG: phosphatase PAP2 family protein [Cytophagales bacterium]|nr:phosphatase PAP2 family protein [Cytophagales bacterium]